MRERIGGTLNQAAADQPGVRVPPPLIFASAFLLGLLMERLFPCAALPKDLRRLLALPCLAVSAALAGWSFAWFLRCRTTLLPSKSSSTLITSGPYRLSRNPLYISTSLLYVGLALWSGTLWALLFLPAATVVIRLYVIAKEESCLERRFGREYRDYAARVRRWI